MCRCCCCRRLWLLWDDDDDDGGGGMDCIASVLLRCCVVVLVVRVVVSRPAAVPEEVKSETLEKIKAFLARELDDKGATSEKKNDQQLAHDVVGDGRLKKSRPLGVAHDVV